MAARLLPGLFLAIGLIVAVITLAGSAGAAPGVRSEGVASCAGTTCHGRLEGDGAIVRQDELARWQEPSSATGAHSRAYSILSGARAQQIASTLGLGAATTAADCLGCHATPAQGARGPRFLASDGVGCEGCHGAAGGWIASHYAVGASHAANVANGLVALDRPIVRANLCLDCHYGSARPGQFVSHRMMAAGHPRVSFELALFSTLQQHHQEDADYGSRKGYSDDLRLWAVGQAVAVKRAATLFAGPRGNEGAFPEFYFFDCQSCHRRIYDQASFDRSWEANPARPIPAGLPPFNDENMILLSAAAKVAAPALAPRFDGDVRAFHAAIANGRVAAIGAGTRLAASADALATALSGVDGSGDLAFAILDRIAAPATAPRFTDYQGSVQAVMATDTLLSALIRQRRVTVGAAAGIRADINRAYAAVREPNGYRPPAFRSALASAIQSIRTLR